MRVTEGETMEDVEVIIVFDGCGDADGDEGPVFEQRRHVESPVGKVLSKRGETAEEFRHESGNVDFGTNGLTKVVHNGVNVVVGVTFGVGDKGVHECLELVVGKERVAGGGQERARMGGVDGEQAAHIPQLVHEALDVCDFKRLNGP